LFGSPFLSLTFIAPYPDLDMISNLKSHPPDKDDGNGLTLCHHAEVLISIRDRTRDLLIVQEHPNGMWWLDRMGKRWTEALTKPKAAEGHSKGLTGWRSTHTIQQTVDEVPQMKMFGHLAVVAVLAFGASAVASQDFENGLTAAGSGDYETALKEWLPLAESGDPSAQFNIGLMYESGQGVPQNDAEAVKWYRLAADQGEPSAQYNLGVMYEYGKGVPLSYDEALRLYHLAAQQDISDAQYNLGVMYNDGIGVEQDYAKAAKWYLLAANKGDGGAMFNLGVLYDTGSGVAKDRGEAIKWYRWAAGNMIAEAQVNLGVIYSEDNGEFENQTLAMMWLIVATQNGAELGSAYQKIVSDKLTPDDISKAQAMASECVSSGYANCGD
jgi:TPR repeat protein